MVIPGEMMLKFISILMDGMEKDLVRVIWDVLVGTLRTGRVILVV